MRMARRTGLGVLIAGLAAVGLLDPTLRYAVWFEYFRIRERASRLPFHEEAWRSDHRQSGVSRTNYWAYLLPTRLRMIDDLMEQRLPEGKTRAEVLALLGGEVELHYFQDWDLVYFLGPGRFGNAIGDSEWLVIRFGPDGIVRDFRVVHD